ncbi:MAG: adenine phosphoribosyltransferase [Gallionellaceae bacterium]|nr:MAG: adenine phosphoribosyltransferase [Gallionellaceae bacterium]
MPIKSRIRTVPHYPKRGIMFRDITTLLKDPVGLRATIDELARRYAGMKIDKIAGIESRGFIVGAPLSYVMGKGFVPNTAPTASKSTPMPSRKVKGCCWWTTSSPPAARRKRPAS